MTINPSIWAPLTVGILTALLGILVLMRERGSMISFIFCLLSIVGSLWLLSYAGVYSARSEAQALRWIRFENTAVVFIPSFVFLFTLAVVQKLRQFVVPIALSFFVSGIFALLVVGTNGFVAGVHHYSWGYYARYGTWSLPFLSFFFGLMFVSLRLYWTEYRRAPPGATQNRLKAFLIAFCIAYLGSVDYLAAYGIPVYPLGFLPVGIFLILAGRTIWRYHLVEITPSFAAEQILRTMADALLVLDGSGVIRVINPAACKLFQRKEKGLLGRTIWQLDGELVSRERLDDTLLAPGMIKNFEVDRITPSGEKQLLEVSAAAVRDQRGNTVGMVCIIRDQTERRKLEKELHETNSAIEGAVEGIARFDAQGRFLFANQSFAQMIGQSPSNLVGKGWQIITHKEDFKQVMAGLRQMLILGRSDMELKILRKDHSSFFGHLTFIRAQSKKGAFDGHYCFLRDLTERNLIEKEVNTLLEQLGRPKRFKFPQ